MSETSFRVTGSELIRFWQNVEHIDGCSVWVGRVNNAGYGVFWFRGENVLAHRFSLKVSMGRDIEEGKWALHRESCSKRCVRHIHEGSPSENARSAWLAGKTNHPKLNVADLAGLKWLISRGVSVKVATKVYGVARSYLHDRKYKECRARR